MMRKNDLLALLARIPGNPPVCTWDGNGATDLVIEQAQIVEGELGRVLLLGFELPQNDNAETVWSDR